MDSRTSKVESMSRATVADLVAMTESSARGYREASNFVCEPRISATLRELAAERAAFEAELAGYISGRGSQFTSMSRHRSRLSSQWAKMRSLIGDPLRLLREIRRGEAYLRRAYQDALAAASTPTVRAAIGRHLQLLKMTPRQLRLAISEKPATS